MIRPWMIYALLIAVYTGVVWYSGSRSSDKKWQAKEVERKLAESATANQVWADRFTLQAQLATRDQQLAASQAAEAQNRTVVVVKKEIIYRDKIKDVSVRDCVANSGVLDVYDATLGLSDSTK